MKTITLPTISLLIAVGAVVFPTASHAAISVWTAVSGSTPDAVGYSLINSASPEVPVLSASSLTLATDSAPEVMLYQMGADKLEFAAITEINFSMKIDSGSSLNTSRGPAAVRVSTGGNVGVILWIGVDEILTNTAPDGRGSDNMTIDTDGGFHNYLMQINGTADGDTISVFQDSSLVLSAALNTSPSIYGPDKRISFGDATGFELGVSQWQNFSHNALIVPETSSSALLVFGLGMGMLRRKR